MVCWPPGGNHAALAALHQHRSCLLCVLGPQVSALAAQAGSS